MNRLVMDYLMVEGHKDAAQCFEVESGTPAGLDLDTVTDRRQVRTAIENGDVSGAIAQINRISPELLTSSPELSFHLHRQQLIELIRAERIDDAEHRCRRRAQLLEPYPH